MAILSLVRKLLFISQHHLPGFWQVLRILADSQIDVDTVVNPLTELAQDGTRIWLEPSLPRRAMSHACFPCLRLRPEARDSVHQILLLAKEGIAELLRPVELVVHHRERLGKGHQRLHAVVPSLLLQRRVEVIALDACVRLGKTRRLDHHLLVRPKAGTPQGGVISPLLPNIYLARLDRVLEAESVSFVRYADDVRLTSRTEVGARQALTQGDSARRSSRDSPGRRSVVGRGYGPVSVSPRPSGSGPRPATR